MCMDDLYQEHILDHSQAPRNFGELAGANLTAEAKNVSCGDSLSVQLRVDTDGRIQDIAWKGEGCAISMAAASILSEQARGKKLSELQHLEFSELLAALGLSSLSPARIKCATLFLHALQRVEHV